MVCSQASHYSSFKLEKDIWMEFVMLRMYKNNVGKPWFSTYILSGIYILIAYNINRANLFKHNYSVEDFKTPKIRKIIKLSKKKFIKIIKLKCGIYLVNLLFCKCRLQYAGTYSFSLWHILSKKLFVQNPGNFSLNIFF